MIGTRFGGYEIVAVLGAGGMGEVYRARDLTLDRDVALKDRRADIWSFGVVQYEMLSGRRPFEGGDVSDTLAAVLTRDVDWTALPAGVPARLQALVADCLTRDPNQRLRDIGDTRIALDRVSAKPHRTGVGGRVAACGGLRHRRPPDGCARVRRRRRWAIPSVSARSDARSVRCVAGAELAKAPRKKLG